jgi:hypothetical protein
MSHVAKFCSRRNPFCSYRDNSRDNALGRLDIGRYQRLTPQGECSRARHRRPAKGVGLLLRITSEGVRRLRSAVLRRLSAIYGRSITQVRLLTVLRIGFLFAFEKTNDTLEFVEIRPCSIPFRLQIPLTHALTRSRRPFRGLTLMPTALLHPAQFSSLHPSPCPRFLPETDSQIAECLGGIAGGE